MKNKYLFAARERITVTNTPVGFTASVYKPTSGDYKGLCATIAKFTVESATIRYKQNGENPSSSDGEIIYETGEDIIYGSQNIKWFRAVKKSNKDAIIDVEYGWG